MFVAFFSIEINGMNFSYVFVLLFRLKKQTMTDDNNRDEEIKRFQAKRRRIVR